MTQEAEQRYRHTAAMGEISGFGGGYEDACQAMLEAGVRWLVEHRDRNPDLAVLAIPSVYGLAKVEGEAGKALEAVVIAAAEDKGGATGAMHHAVMSRLAWINEHGWEEYVAELTRLRAGEGQ